MRLFLFSLCAVLFCACNDYRITQEDHFDNGRLEKICIDSKALGETRCYEFFPNGSIRSVCIDALVTDMYCVEYSEDGFRLKAGLFQHNRGDYLEIEHYETGGLRSLQHFSAFNIESRDHRNVIVKMNEPNVPIKINVAKSQSPMLIERRYVNWNMDGTIEAAGAIELDSIGRLLLKDFNSHQ